MVARLPESTVTFGALIKSLPVLRDSALIARSTSAPATDQPVLVKVFVASVAKSITESKAWRYIGTAQSVQFQNCLMHLAQYERTA